MQPDFKHLIRMCDNIERTIHRIPNKAAVIATNFSKERFIKKNWVDEQGTQWKKTRKKKGSTLIKSGRLKRSIHKIHIGADYAIVGTDVPYARAHNDGGTFEGTERVRSHERKAHRRKAYISRTGKRIKATTVKAHTVKSYKRKYKRTFVQRKFIGKSQFLENNLTAMMQSEIQRAIQV